MNINIIGKLPADSDLVSEPLDQVKQINVYVLRGEDSYKKIRNIVKSYNDKKMPVKRIPSSVGMNGYEVTFRLKSINGKLGANMLNLPRASWANQMFELRGKTSNYNLMFL